MRSACDYLVVGGGIIGVSVARELKRRHSDASVVLLEKEDGFGRHASGRNSGVLHAGFYYSADSFKARFTREGNRRLTEYCLEHGLTINRCGKLVVATNETELDGLDELARRGVLNGVELEQVTSKEVQRLEPRARTVGRALFSPSSAAVDPRQVLGSLVDEATAAGAEFRAGVAYVGRRAEQILTSDGAISAGFVVNAAGLYADRIARDFGFGGQYRILPFKGLYLTDTAGAETIRRHIYPVPELRYPFLGVHFSVAADGRSKIGPTAIPALWREHYSGLENFDLGELRETLALEASLFGHNAFDFRALARREIAKYSRRRLCRLASRLVHGLHPASRWRWGPAGIRAQLVDLEKQELVMDFRVEGDGNSLHVLNAVSPAFTCALPFAEYLADRVDELAGTRSEPVELTPERVRA